MRQDTPRKPSRSNWFSTLLSVAAGWGQQPAAVQPVRWRLQPILHRKGVSFLKQTQVKRCMPLPPGRETSCKASSSRTWSVSARWVTRRHTRWWEAAARFARQTGTTKHQRGTKTTSLRIHLFLWTVANYPCFAAGSNWGWQRWSCPFKTV